MLAGVERGWLTPSAEYLPAVRKGWAALTHRVNPNGTVAGVCMGTGIEPDVAGYVPPACHSSEEMRLLLRTCRS